MEDQWIVKENISRYRRLLETATGERDRSVLTRLMAELEAKLVPASARPADAPNGTGQGSASGAEPLPAASPLRPSACTR